MSVKSLRHGKVVTKGFPCPLPRGEGVRMAVLRTAAAKGCRLWKPLFWKIDFRGVFCIYLTNHKFCVILNK